MKRLLAFVFLLALPATALPQTADAEAMRMEMVFWESVRGSNDPADFRAYLEKYPNGAFARLARNRLAQLEPPPAPAQAAPIQAAPAQAASSAAKGPLNPGDTWTYRALDVRAGKQVGVHEVRLVSMVGENVTEEIFDQGTSRRIDHKRGLYLVPAGKYTVFSPYLLAFGTPQLGMAFRGIDNLDGRTCNAGWTCNVTGRTIGWDKVRVPAGEFNALKVEIYQSWTSPSQTNDRGETVSRTMTVWYSPQAKRPVRMVSRGTPSANVDTEFELELVSFRLN